jgi:hypothetical protein
MLQCRLIPNNSSLASTLGEDSKYVQETSAGHQRGLSLVLERLHERQMRGQDQPPIADASPGSSYTRPPGPFGLLTREITLQPMQLSLTEWKIIDGWIVLLINAASLLDGNIMMKS